ncbi:replication initiation factor domain-containing protein [Virgibacillus halodenitrificans]|uniref:Replication initiation factor domain-containing protein n=1 Tax=Virgibacillus halodenitrificans TaxID=1482 RepID=A0ABR7VQ39_VIRHA|nr:replication initiation factor domain-containing protein [Virgibacillus halodenitrificans]MBD1224026.1 replication initiation factor domain-containing protein [Virgibacillus halodenitrificans]
MLDVQVDEFTLVLQTTKRPNSIETWSGMAISLIDEFTQLANIELILGELEDSTDSLPRGYSHGLSCKDAPYYFSIAYHTDFIQMGVCIKFSAYAWMKYREQYEALFTQSIQIHQFISSIDNTNLYTSRLSRIDIAIDFIEEDISVNTIYNQLSKKNQIVRTASGRNNLSNLSALTKNNETSTFYLGTRGKNIKALLRVYDKKIEQKETMGTRYKESLHYSNWVRFEAVYKGAYAHNISDGLKSIKDNVELKNLLVSALTDRYQFYYAKSNKLTTYSKSMVDLLDKKSFMFSSPSPRMNLLEQSQQHILNGSGLFPYLFKVRHIWGEEGLKECVAFLYNEFNNYEPNDDVMVWLKRYSTIYTQQGYPFK